MAKSIDLLLILFGSFICLYSSNNGLYVNSENGIEIQETNEGANLLNARTEPQRTRFLFKHGVNEKNSEAARQNSVYNREVVILKENEKALRQRLQSIYSKEVGVREKTNKNDGERIAEYLKYTGLAEGYAWCASFVSWSFGQAGFKEPKTAWSPSLFPSKRIIWDRGSVKIKPLGILKPPDHLPEAGDVFGIYFPNLKRIAHAGFVDEWGDKYAITVEGNTNEGNSRDGDGVYRKRRPISSIYQVADWLPD